MEILAARIHHFVYAAAAVAIVAIIAFFFGPRPHPEPAPSQTPVAAAPGSVQREVQAAIAAEAMRIAAGAPAPIYARPAVSVVQPLLKGYTSGEVAAILSALGRQNTAPVVHVAIAAPSPLPTITPPPDVPPDFAAWHHRDVYDATAEALKATQVQVTVTQEPIPPSRTQSLLLSDQSAGIAYAVRRRGQFDLDLGVTERGAAVQPTAGVAYRVKGTQAGLFAGITVQRGHPRPALGFTIAF